MSRDHTMFIQSQCLRWTYGGLGAAHAGMASRLLSRDPSTGAATLLLRLPAGWQRDDAHYLSAMEELYVLQGDLAIGEQRYVPHTYACRAAGSLRCSSHSKGGAIVLAMYAQQPELQRAAAAPSYHDPALDVPYINAYTQGLEGWQENPHTRYLVGTGVQTLRQDPMTGEITILYSALPFRYMEKRWTHKHVQEMYVLAGEYSINDVGVMRPGAYAWWEPEHLHGPYGSLTGFMMLIRSCGGPLENVIPDARIAVDYHAPYRPVLPAAMAALARPTDTLQAW